MSLQFCMNVNSLFSSLNVNVSNAQCTHLTKQEGQEKQKQQVKLLLILPEKHLPIILLMLSWLSDNWLDFHAVHLKHGENSVKLDIKHGNICK